MVDTDSQYLEPLILMVDTLLWYQQYSILAYFVFNADSKKQVYVNTSIKN